MTEQQFTNEVISWAKAYKWKVFHVRLSGHAGMAAVQGDRGFPDLILVRGQRWLAIELKVEKAGTKRGDPRPDQIAWLAVLRQVGAETYVWRPTDWGLAVLR